MNVQPIFIREEIIKSAREFFFAKSFHEVITPTLATALPLEPTLYAFETNWKTIHGDKKTFLTASPESGLKKMLAAGIGNCFAIAKSFRNLEDAGNTHIPEFLLLEWYRENATYKDIMDDTQNLILYIKQHVDHYRKKTPDNHLMYQGKTIDTTTPWKTYSFVDLYTQYAGISLEQVIDEEALIKVAKSKGYETIGATWEQLFNQLFLNEIEPHLGSNPCFITDFPAKMSPLCKPQREKPYLAERFEVYIAGMELGNGNTENTDTKSVKAVFDAEQEYRNEKGILTPPIDDIFLQSLDAMNGKSIAGIGLGIDRLAMIFADVTDISEVEPLVIK
jgi:elongation factor P--(R)-beta-lysine ligase